jgi:hypothetical protein
MAPTTEDVVRRAARWVDEGRRLDLVALAAEMGISRATLHRRVGNREMLLGRALWYTTERAMAALGAEGGGAVGAGAGGAAASIAEFNRRVAAWPALRRLLDEEPITTVRVLTDPRGFFQPRIVAVVEHLLRRDRGAAGEPAVARADQLAYALVRLSESFLYADAIADRTPDVDTANALMTTLIDAWLASPPTG